MKFSVSSSLLQKHLQMVGGVISSNPVLPILEDFLFDILDNKLTITATDLETSIQTSIDIVSDGDGKVAIPAKILLETLKALPPQPITLEVNKSTNSIEITSSYGNYKLIGELGSEYPQIAQPVDIDSFVTNTSKLANAISKTIFATSSDELRPAMTGVFFQVDFNTVTFVATDAHKLVTYTIGNINSDVSATFIVPKKALNLLKGTLPPNMDINISFNGTNAFFYFENIKLACRLIDARYPDYNAVIPIDNPNLLVVNRVDLLNSLKRIAIYANKTTNQVILTANEEGSLNISSQDLDFSNEAKENIPCSYEGEALSIGFNAKFLIEMLGVLETEEVKFQLSNPMRAGILYPSEFEKGEEILMLVMPVLLNP